MRAARSGKARRSLQYAHQPHNEQATSSAVPVAALAADFDRKPAPEPVQSRSIARDDAAFNIPTCSPRPGSRSEGELPGSVLRPSQAAHAAAVDITAILLRAAVDRRRSRETTSALSTDPAGERAGQDTRSPEWVRQDPSDEIAAPSEPPTGRG